MVQNQFLEPPRSNTISSPTAPRGSRFSHIGDVLAEYADPPEPIPRNPIASLGHIIFKVCIRCSFNTKDEPERSRTTGPSFFCPKCEAPSFIIACTICQFESLADCPLIELLLRRPKEKSTSPGGGDCPERRNESRGIEDSKHSVQSRIRRRKGSVDFVEPSEAEKKKKRSEDKPSSAEIVKRYRASRDLQKLEQKAPGGVIVAAPKEPEEELEVISSHPMERLEDQGLEKGYSHNQKLQQTTDVVLERPDPPPLIVLLPPAHMVQSSCPQCTQAHCMTCSPGYMNMVVDMKEFSITFASDIKLCTMCKHWLCPKSSLEVLFRCRGCGHERCNNCEEREDEFGEEWCVCCKCPRKEITAGQEINGEA